MGKLLQLYALLLSGILLGWLVGQHTPAAAARSLGDFIFWLGAPFTIAIFMYGADLSGVWLAPGVAWLPSLAIKMLVVPRLTGLGLTLWGIEGGTRLAMVGCYAACFLDSGASRGL